MQNQNIRQLMNIPDMSMGRRIANIGSLLYWPGSVLKL